MPVDMSKYPPEWDSEIRPRILRRAGGREDDPRVGAKCEECGVVNYSVGYRDEEGFHLIDDHLLGNDYYTEGKYRQSYAAARKAADIENEIDTTGRKWIVIVLTIAHIHDPDPMNCDDDNLMALCQACHNRLDMPMRKRNAAESRRQSLIESGQMELFNSTVRVAE